VGGAIAAVGEFLKDRVLDAKYLILEAVGELFLAVVSLGLLAAVATLVTWGWGRSPAATAGLLAGIAGFLAYGCYELFGRTTRKRGRLAATAAGAAVFTALWAMGLAVYYVG
jgi:cysteine synthase